MKLQHAWGFAGLSYSCNHAYKLQEAKQLKQLMQSLATSGKDEDSGRGTSITLQSDPSGKPLIQQAFVFTDIESSTELSSQDPDAFKAVRVASLCKMCGEHVCTGLLHGDF